jgi:hypothetical protein
MKSILFVLGTFGLVLTSTPTHAATITQRWISKDESIATVTIQGLGSVRLPTQGGGEVVVGCRALSCSITLADFKDKKGNITYDTNLSGLQNVSGAIDFGRGRFDISTSGFDELFSEVSVFGDLIDSTGFEATIGLPGDQLTQGGSINYSTRWLSEEVIGIDPITGEGIILGDFFLNSTAPLSVFDFSVDDPTIPSISSTFTTGQKYIFSSGLEISGTVTKNLTTVPDVPEPLTILGTLSALGIGAAMKRKSLS